jgi:hypothetical protein
MNKTALALAAVAVLGCKKSEPQAKPDRVSPHGKEIDSAHAPQIAMFKAPEGATPCESALNAFNAEVEAARTSGSKSIFTFVADRDTFLAGCKALAPEVQACLVPHYAARHRDDCNAALPPNAQLANLFVLRDDASASAKEPPLPTPKP